MGEGERRGGLVPKPPIVDLSGIDMARVAYDIEAIRQVNKQRHEMEQLTAVVSMDRGERSIVAYKDITDREFWVQGHIPGRPLMPGVIMCEAAAQAASFLLHYCLENPPEFVGFGGMDRVKFRGTVVPGDRFVVAGRITHLRRRRSIFECQGFVGERMVFEGTIYGMPLEQP